MITKIKKYVGLILLALALTGLISTVTVSSAAAWSTSDRRFVSIDSDPIKMCKSWVGPSWHDACGSTRAYIWNSSGHKYTKSDLGWTDTDGLYDPPGWIVAYATVRKYAPDGAWYRIYDGGHWVKIQGCSGCLTKVKRYKK